MPTSSGPRPQDRAPGRGAFAAQLYNGKIDRAGVTGGVLSRAELDRARAAGAAPAGDAVRLLGHHGGL